MVSMATASAEMSLKRHPLAATIILSVVGYAVVIGTFIGIVPAQIYPDLSLTEVNIISDAIAVVNAVNVIVILAGWRWIRRNEVRKHAAAMLTSFGLILIFLVLYLTKIGGGGTKEFVGPAVAYYPYLGMLAIHILLSIISVPVVLYAIVLGITHTPQELREQTPHRRVGRIAASAWVLSLTLGVVAYVLLNHTFGWEYIESGTAVILTMIMILV
jgi:putative membrane protein